MEQLSPPGSRSSYPGAFCCRGYLLLKLLLLLGSRVALGALPTVLEGDVVDENNSVEGSPVPLTLLEAVTLIQRHQEAAAAAVPHVPAAAQANPHKVQGGTAAQAKDLPDQEPEDPRFIGITDGGLYRGDLVVYLPITVLLPTFAFRSRYSQAGKKKSDWLSFLLDVGKTMGMGRSYQDDNELEDIRGPVDRLILQDQVKYDPTLPEYQKDIKFGPLLSRMDAYFTYLRVHDDGCRQRAICQLAQDPGTFAPLSHLVISVLRKSEGYSRPETYEPSVFRFLRYYWAAERGADNGDCARLYDQCPADLRDILNMRVLGFWQKLATLVSFKLADE